MLMASTLLMACALLHPPSVAPLGRFPAPVARAPAPLLSAGLGTLSVGELKALLAERGIDFRDCLEKQDLIERLEASKPSVNAFAERARGLTQDETQRVQVFKEVSPAVAYIQTVQLSQSGIALRPTEYSAGQGSGFVWDADGHCVTNYHVVAGGRSSSEIPRKLKVSLQGLKEPLDGCGFGEVLGVPAVHE